jgi:predicted nucleic acid-binding protein
MGIGLMSYLVDSVIFIDHFNGIEVATDFIAKHRERIALSAITRAEVLTGFDSKGQRNAKALLDYFPNYAITPEEADMAADLRRKYRWKLPDALQAAVALLHELRLVTRNTKDFQPRNHEFVVVPYTL